MLETWDGQAADVQDHINVLALVHTYVAKKEAR